MCNQLAKKIFSRAKRVKHMKRIYNKLTNGITNTESVLCSPDIIRIIDITSKVARGRLNPALITSNFKLVRENAREKNGNVEEENEFRVGDSHWY